MEEIKDVETSGIEASPEGQELIDNSKTSEVQEDIQGIVKDDGQQIILADVGNHFHNLVYDFEHSFQVNSILEDYAENNVFP